jgi:large repetitive protein
MISSKKFFLLAYLALFFLVSGVSGMLLLSKGIEFFQLEKENSTLTDLQPVASFTYTQTDQCASSPIQFTNTTAGDSLTYFWNFGDGENSTLESPEHIFDKATGNGTQTYNVSLTVTDTLGLTSTTTETITVNQIPSTQVGSDRDNIDFENLPFFIVCDNDESSFTFYNTSTTKDSNVSYTIEWGDGSEPFVADDWSEVSHEYPIGVFNLEYTIVGGNGCSITKRIGIFIGSNPAVGFGNPGNTNICFGEALTFPITGTENNPEGTTYTVTFSDGSPPQVFNHPPPPSVSHIFNETSCGKTGGQGFPNSFSATILAENPCSKSSAQVVPIYISEKPEPIIGLADSVFCQNNPFDIENNTLYGNEVSNNGQCTNEGKFVWQITPATGWELTGGTTLGVQNNPNIPNSWINGSDIITPSFSVPGTYTIKLISGNRCGIEETERTICIIPEPVASFELDNTEGCGPFQVTASNTSNILGSCADTSNVFTWSVVFQGSECSDTGGWAFAEGSGPNSINPVFNFTEPGNYLITQSLTTTCGVFTASEVVSVFAPPTVSIDNVPDACGELTLTPVADVSGCGTSPNTILWTFEGGTPATANTLDPGEILYNTPGLKTITLEVTNACGTTVESIEFELNALPVVDAGGDLEICKGETISLNAEVTPEATYTYSWTANPQGVIQNATSKTPTISPTESTTYTVEVRNTQTGCINTDQVFVIVTPAPIVEISIPDQVICSGETSQSVSFSSNPLGLQIEWTSQSNGVQGVIPAGINEIPSQTLINTSPTPIEVVFLAKIVGEDLGACEELVSTYRITVNPEPVYQNQTIEICSESALDFTPAGVLPGSTFTWTVSSNPEIAGASDSTEPSPAVQNLLTNNSKTLQTITYTISPFLAGCPGTPFTLTVGVQPKPAISFSMENQTLCTGTSSEEVQILSDVANTSFSWTATPNGVQGVALTGTGNTIPIQSLVNPTPNPVTVTYQVIASVGTQAVCTGTPETYSITVNPSITLVEEVSDFSGFGISCFGANDGRISVTPSGGNGNFTFTWTGPGGFSSASQTIENLLPGTYDLSIEDDFGCGISRSYTITEPDILQVTFVDKRDVFVRVTFPDLLKYQAQEELILKPTNTIGQKMARNFQ